VVAFSHFPATGCGHAMHIIILSFAVYYCNIYMVSLLQHSCLSCSVFRWHFVTIGKPSHVPLRLPIYGIAGFLYISDMVCNAVYVTMISCFLSFVCTAMGFLMPIMTVSILFYTLVTSTKCTMDQEL